jgi:tetratricopeptide (TPR) repeat protein
VTATSEEPRDERSIRVFVSSTFRDMQAEREELVKRVFPLVRRRCEERGVGWSEVDLRWGVTDEAKAEGAVLPICLAEIDRSRPFFLGLLGRRYGWVPDEVPEDLGAQLPWLRDHPGTSVTELEVLHGVLNDPEASGHAFFHLLADDGSPDPDEGPEAAERQAALRSKVEASGHPCATYADPTELGRQVLDELMALVDRLHPVDDVADPAQRADHVHRAFGAARRAGHVARPGLVERLTVHADGDGPPLVLAAPDGSDVTPLVAAWADERARTHPDEVVAVHHVAATSAAADWRDLAGRSTLALRRAVGDDRLDPASSPDDAAGRRAALFDAIERAGRAGSRAVLIVDGCELLDDVDGAPELTWLPLHLPPSIRVVLTSSSALTTDEALRRGWAVAEAPPLDADERRRAATAFLARWSKGLDAVHLDRLVAAPQTGSALFLRTVLDELRQHGDHVTLAEVIDRHLAAATDDDLLEQVLARYEQDYERDRPGLVAEAMSAIWASRRGLSEPELRDLLGNGEPLPQAIWSPLLLAAEAGLVVRGGRIGFATTAHRTAVADRYLPDQASRARAADRLARHFATEPLGPRVVEELPWAQLAAGDLDGLVATLSDLRFLEVAHEQAPADLRRLWARAEAAGRSVVTAHRAVLDDPAAHPEVAWAVARLVTDAGHGDEALALHRFLVEHHRAGPGAAHERGPARLRASLVNLGAAQWLQGRAEEAERSLTEAVDLSRAAGDGNRLHAALGNLGLVQRDRGELAAAVATFEEAAARCRDVGDSWGLQSSLGNQAAARRQQGSYAEALVLLTEQEAICRAIGEGAGLGAALAGQAAVLADQGDPAAALARFEAHRRWAVDAGDRRAEGEALLNEAGTLRQVGRREEAAGRFAEGEALVRRTGDQVLLARVLDGRARLAADEARWPDARQLAEEAALTARSADAPSALVLALSSLGTARRELGDLAGAGAAHREELTVAEQLGDPSAAATARVNLGNLAIASNDLRGALEHYAAAEPALRARDLAMVLVPLLNNRWQVHQALGDGPAALADLIDCGHQAVRCGAHAQAQQVLSQAVQHLYASGQQARCGPVFEDLVVACRATGDEAALQQAIGDHALLVLGTGDLDRAGAMLDEQEGICRRIGDQVGLAACVGNRAILERQRGDLGAALRCVDEQLAIARASGNGQGVLFATANRGDVLGAMGRIDEGLAALGEARQLAAQWNLGPMVQQLDQMIATLRSGGPS